MLTTDALLNYPNTRSFRGHSGVGKADSVSLAEICARELASVASHLLSIIIIHQLCLGHSPTSYIYIIYLFIHLCDVSHELVIASTIQHLLTHTYLLTKSSAPNAIRV